MKKIFKKFLIGATLITSGLFFNISFTRADTTAPNQANTATQQKRASGSAKEKSNSDNLKMFQNLSKGLYAITWPLIMIAGKFMENDVIYGRFIGMEQLLWGIWNVMRTFANYIIGITLIFSIFTLFLGGKFEKFNPLKIMPQLVVSSVLVNASWFIFEVCLDLSTIMTFAVGLMPLNMSDHLNIKQKPIPTFVIKFQNGKNPVKVGVKHGKKILPFCEMTALAKGKAGVKIFPKNKKEGCAYEYENKYYHVTKPVELPEGKKVKGSDIGQEIKTQTFEELLRKHPGMSSVLGTLYASILNIGRMASSTSGTTVGMTSDLMFKALFLFALIIPLFTFALIMIARAVVLWMFIIISPIVFLFTSIKGFGDKILGEKGNFKEMCCMVFLPVTVTFALSISFVFLSTLKFVSIKKGFGIDGKGNEVYIQTDGTKEHRITIKFKDTGKDSATTNLYGLFQNTLLWIIKLMFAVGFMWTLVFTALKSCKITSGIAIFVQKFAQSMAKAAPVLPGGQSLASLGQGMHRLQQLPSEAQMHQRENLEKLFGGGNEGGTGGGNAQSVSNDAVSSTNKTHSDIEQALGKKVHNGNKEIKAGDVKMDDLKKNKKLRDEVAKATGVSSQQLLDHAKTSSGKLSDDKNQEWIEDSLNESKVKKLLNESANKGINIDQLSEKAKDLIHQVFDKSHSVKTKPNKSEIKIGSHKLEQALKEFGIQPDDITKLMTKNTGNQSPNTP